MDTPIKADPRIDLKCSLTVLILQKLNTWKKQLFLFEYYYAQTCITYAADFFFLWTFKHLFLLINFIRFIC